MTKQRRGTRSPGESSGDQSHSRGGTLRTILFGRPTQQATPLERFWAWRFFAITILGIFVAEMIAMLVIVPFRQLPYWVQTLIDSSVMVVLIFPVVYFFSLRPLIHHIEMQQRTQAALQQSETRFAKAFHSSPVASCITRVSDGTFIDVNERFLEVSGYGRADLLGHTSIELDLYVDPQHRNKIVQLLGTRVGANDIEIMFKVRSGEVRNFILYTEGITLGDEACILSTAIDVTERKRADEIIKKERQRFYDVLETLPAYLVLLTPDYHVPFANRFFRERFGEANGRRCYEYLFGRDQPCDICGTYEALELGRPKNWEWTGPDGRTYDVHDYLFTDTDGSTLILEMGIDITDRKRAEATVLLLSRIVEQTEDTVVVTNPEGKIEYVNPAFERLTGYAKEEAVGNTPRVLKSGLHDERFYHDLWNTILKGEVFLGEMANRKKGGELFYEVKTITPLRDTQGNITHFVATGKDITAHKRAEEKLLKAYAELEMRVEERTEELQIAIAELEDEINVRSKVETALRRSEARLRQAEEIAHLGSWELDLENNLLTWSDEVYRIFGMQPQEFKATYEAFLEVIHPDDRVAVDDAYTGSIRDGKDTYEIEHRIVKRSSGEIRILHEKCEHFRNPAGQIIRSIGMVHDITERKHAEEALRQARDDLELRVQKRTVELVREIAERKEVERQLRIQTTAMEAAANGIIITDCDGGIQWTNPAIFQITGYTESELLHRNMSIFKSGEQGPEYYQAMWNAILAGEVWRGELINCRKDGTPYAEEQTITPVRDETGQIQHFIAIKQDISQRKQAEAELERRNLELQAISIAEHKQRQFSEALVSAAIVLSRSLKLDEVLSLILQQINLVVPYQFADITLLDGESFYEGSRQGYLDLSNITGSLRLHQPLDNFPSLRKMKESGQPILIYDTDDEANWVSPRGLGWGRSFLAAPLIAEGQMMGSVNLFGDQPGFFTEQMCQHLVAFATHAVVAIQNAWLFEQVRSSSERLQSLSRRLVEIQESERLNIARELHDEAGQMLTSLMVDLRLLENQAAQPELVLEKVKEMEQTLNEVLESLHRVAMSLRPATLDHLGLVAALRQHVETIAEKHGLEIHFSSGKVSERLPANVETVLYRIVQEALTNIVRHARASRVDVILTMRDGKLVLIVEDDGIGFDPQAVQAGEHLGLFGMRERTETIGGKLVIESQPGKGTTLMVEVNYADSVIDRR